MWKLSPLVLGFALMLGVSACTSMTGRSAGRNVDDASITASVKSRLAADKASSLTRIDVDTVNGTVYLTGTVTEEQDKHRAGQIAGEVGGVDRVVNNLQTRRAADAPRSTSPPY